MSIASPSQDPSGQFRDEHSGRLALVGSGGCKVRLHLTNTRPLPASAHTPTAGSREQSWPPPKRRLDDPRYSEIRIADSSGDAPASRQLERRSAPTRRDA